MTGRLYIPIWLYSNIDKSTYISPLKAFTFQSGYIQIGMIFFATFYRLSLYIPIWLYSNTVQDDTGERSITFTFQSGYIQIGLRFFDLVFCIYTLHSNLVIFKSILDLGDEYFNALYIPIWLYSNFFCAELS